MLSVNATHLRHATAEERFANEWMVKEMQKALDLLGTDAPQATDLRRSGDLPDISVGPDQVYDRQVFRNGADHVGPVSSGRLEPEPQPSTPSRQSSMPGVPDSLAPGEDVVYTPLSPANSSGDAADIPVGDLEHDQDLEGRSSDVF